MTTRRSRSSTKAAAEVISVALGDRRVDIRRELRPVAELRLDPDNPRLGALLARRGGRRRKPAQAEIERRLAALPQVQALARSIEQNGGLLEDPVVRHDGTVVEGNCRTVALRRLGRERPRDPRFRAVHVRVLPADVSEVQIALLLGDLHIAQKLPWHGFDQAAYVWRMFRQHGTSKEHLATHLRWTQDKLEQKLAAFEEAQAYAAASGETSVHERFPLFEALMSRPELRERLRREEDFLPRFRDWVQRGLLRSAREVRELAPVLADEEARELFESAGAAAALELLGRRDPTRDGGLYWHVDRTARKLEEMPLTALAALRDGDRPRRELLERLGRALDRVEEAAGLRLRKAAAAPGRRPAAGKRRHSGRGGGDAGANPG